jgi:hypothetical protein
VAKQSIDLPKLREVIRRDYAELQSFRKNRVEHVAEYLGNHYGTAKQENPLNVISQFVNTVVRQLVGGEPRAMCSTFDRKLRPFAEAMQDDLAIRLKALKYGEVLRKKVLDAMFLMGITKRSIIAPNEIRFGGYARVAGEVGISTIDFEDFVFDTSVSCFADAEYMGNFYYCRLDDVKDSKLFKASARKNLQPSEPRLYNEGGDPRMVTLGMSAIGNNERYEEYIRLCEIWLPRYGTILTFAVDQESEEPLLEQEWVGPESGPYDFLSLQDAPGKSIPKAPIMDLIDLAKSINTHWKHLDNQASQQKDIVAYQDEGDAEKLQRAGQGEFLSLRNPAAVVPIKMFGINQELATWAQMEREAFNKQSGNLDALGGLGTSAKTYGQEKLINESSSGLIAAWSARVIASAKSDMEALGWFFWNNPHQTLESTYQLPGMPDVTADRSVSPQARAGIPWSKMQLDIDPYSLSFTPPNMRVAILDQMVKEIFLPLAPMFAQPGIGELLEKYIRLKAKYVNMPEIVELAESIIGSQGDPQVQPGGPPQMPGNDTTTHERVSKPGMTDKGNQQVLQQLMAGGESEAGAGGMGLGQMGAA